MKETVSGKSVVGTQENNEKKKQAVVDLQSHKGQLVWQYTVEEKLYTLKQKEAVGSQPAMELGVDLRFIRR